MLKKAIALTILTGFFAALGAAASVGVAPGSVDLGEVNSGETVEQDFYITTNYNQNFFVQPSFRSGSRSTMFDEDNERRYETSEADISEWVSVQDEVEVEPNNTQRYTLDDGRSVNANGFFRAQISVPYDAEPGYYYGSFNLDPETDSEVGGAGTETWGVARPNFRFRVSGQVERGIEINNVEGVRTGNDRVQIIKQLQNTGTVTTRLSGGNITVLNEEGESLDEFRIGSATLAPGEVAEIDTTWSSENVEGGNYQVDGIGDYRTGETHISGDFAITGVIRDPVDIDEPDAESEDDADIPYTLLLMVLLFLGVILYLLEIDLVWIIIFVGVTGISLFIIFSSAPTYLILILASLIGVILYYGI